MIKEVNVFAGLFETEREGEVKSQDNKFNPDLFSAAKQACITGKESSTIHSYSLAFKEKNFNSNTFTCLSCYGFTVSSFCFSM